MMHTNVHSRAESVDSDFYGDFPPALGIPWRRQDKQRCALCQRINRAHYITIPDRTQSRLSWTNSGIVVYSFQICSLVFIFWVLLVNLDLYVVLKIVIIIQKEKNKNGLQRVTHGAFKWEFSYMLLFPKSEIRCCTSACLYLAFLHPAALCSLLHLPWG